MLVLLHRRLLTLLKIHTGITATMTNSSYKSTTFFNYATFRRVSTFKDQSYDLFRTSSHYKEFLTPLKILPDSLNNNQLGILNIQNLPKLDRNLTKILPKCKSNKEVLQLANIWYQVSNGSIRPNLPFYRELIVNHSSQFIQSSNHPKELILWSFILSQAKKSIPEAIKSQKLVLEQFKTLGMDHFRDLQVQEVAVLCNGLFAAGVTLSQGSMLLRVDELLQQEPLDSLNAQPLLKVIRAAGYCSHQLLDSVASSLSKPEAQNLNLAQATHALSFLADHHYPIQGPIIVENVIHILRTGHDKLSKIPEKHTHPTRGTRAKDLTRILWALSCVLVGPANDKHIKLITDEMIPFLEEAWDGGHLQVTENCHLVSDAFLSLACWNTYPKTLIEKVMTKSFVDSVLSENSSKQLTTLRQSRLALFLVAAEIEAPHLSLSETLRKQVLSSRMLQQRERKREKLVQLAGAMHQQSENLGWTEIHYHSLIPHLNIAGLTFISKGTRVAVELLDSSVCMWRCQQPARLQALKIRLVEKLGHKVIQVPCSKGEEIQRMVDFIREKLLT